MHGLRTIGAALTPGDVGLHFPIEVLLETLRTELQNVDWNTRTVTAAYAPYYRKAPCMEDVLAGAHAIYDTRTRIGRNDPFTISQT